MLKLYAWRRSHVPNTAPCEVPASTMACTSPDSSAATAPGATATVTQVRRTAPWMGPRLPPFGPGIVLPRPCSGKKPEEHAPRPTSVLLTSLDVAQHANPVAGCLRPQRTLMESSAVLRIWLLVAL